jgi:Fe2+ transport system protein B
MALKEKLDEIEAKVRLLNFAIKKTDDRLGTNDEEVVIRQKGQVTKIILAISDLKQTIEEKKFVEGDTDENVAAWGESIEKSIALGYENVRQLNVHIQRLKAEVRRRESARENENKRLLDKENYARQQAFKKHERDRQLAFEQELMNQKLQHQKEIKELQVNQAQKSSSTTKLPKLVITPFNGSYHNWLRFWGQFSASIDATDIPDVMKFSYLKELMEPKIRTCIDGLPFTTEGIQECEKNS